MQLPLKELFQHRHAKACARDIAIAFKLLLLTLLALVLAAFATKASAAEISAQHSTARALGMGDAFSSLAGDSSSLFYNPAGLSRVTGLNWKILSFRGGASNLNAYKKLQGVVSSEGGGDFADKIQELYGEDLSAGFGAESAFTAPLFGFAVYDHMDALVRVHNPVYPELYTSVINDYGYVAGLGAPIGPFMEAGLAFKYVKRTGARMTFTGSSLADLDPDEIKDRVMAWGQGYGADAGMNIVLPAPFFRATFSTVWRNIGQMRFRSDNPSVEIPYEDNDLTLGLSLAFETPLVSITPAIDFRYLNSSDYQLTRKINFGIEVGLPLLDIRAGFREGYYTYGAGVNLGLFRVDAASYGVELGAYPGQIEDRRYVVEFAMELGVGNFGPGGASGSSAKGGANGGRGPNSGSSSRSIWGTGRLKQRR